MLSIFDFEEQPVRLFQENGQPWFNNPDVCRILGISNAPQAVAALDDDEKMTISNAYSHSGQRGGAQSHTYISESGLYALIFKSRKPQAKAFRKWVTSEVLPAIRKTGQYVAPEAPAALAPSAPLPVQVPALPQPVYSITEYCKISTAGWCIRAIGEFGRLAKRTASNLGWCMKKDAGGWHVYPLDFLDQLWLEYEEDDALSPVKRMRAILIAKATELEDDAILTLREIAAHDLSEGDCKALGLALKPWRGAALRDRRGRLFRMRHQRTKLGARYHIHFEGAL